MYELVRTIGNWAYHNNNKKCIHINISWGTDPDWVKILSDKKCPFLKPIHSKFKKYTQHQNNLKFKIEICIWITFNFFAFQFKPINYFIGTQSASLCDANWENITNLTIQNKTKNVTKVSLQIDCNNFWICKHMVRKMMQNSTKKLLQFKSNLNEMPYLFQTWFVSSEIVLKII